MAGYVPTCKHVIEVKVTVGLYLVPHRTRRFLGGALIYNLLHGILWAET